jgi:hypothetical protein
VDSDQQDQFMRKILNKKKTIMSMNSKGSIPQMSAVLLKNMKMSLKGKQSIAVL